MGAADKAHPLRSATYAVLLSSHKHVGMSCRSCDCYVLYCSDCGIYMEASSVPSQPSLSFPRSRIVNELPICLPARLWPVFCRLLRRLTPIELSDDLRADAVQLLLGEDTKQAPRKVQ